MCFPRQTVGGSEKSQLHSIVAMKSASFTLADVQSDAFIHAFSTDQPF